MKGPHDKSAPLQPGFSDADREEAIRRRAYEIYETQGKEDGHDMEHWLEAEADVRGGHSQPVSEEPDAETAPDTLERHEPPFTKTHGIVAPKFGSAGSGGAEYERLPEAHVSAPTEQKPLPLPRSRWPRRRL